MLSAIQPLSPDTNAGGGGILYCRRTLTGSKSDSYGHVTLEASSGHDNVLTLYSIGGFLYWELKASATGYCSQFHTYEFDCASVPQAFIPTRMRLGLEKSSLTIFSGDMKDPTRPNFVMPIIITLTASGTVHASINVSNTPGNEYTAVGEKSSLPSGAFVGGTEVA